ncbi:MAG: PAS domain S-box protein [bacterium]|nr:PAS domain S-box protein [bacterium]
MSRLRTASSSAKHLLHERSLLLLLLVLFLFGGATWVTWSFARFSSNLVETAAIEDAETLAVVIEEFRALYTSEVVERVRHHGIDVTHDYESSPASIPLPATLSLQAVRNIPGWSDHGSVRLYSDQPFPWREDGGPHDDFEREALRRLKSAPDEPFFQLDGADGSRTLRFAVADRMRAGCVECHNTHPQSPKVDWRAGDVRGVLEIVRPLGDVTAATNASIREFFAHLMLLAVVALVGLTLLLARIRRGAPTPDDSGYAGADFSGGVRGRLLLVEALVLALVLAFDLSVPLGVATGLPYVLVVLLSVWSRRERHTYAIAMLATGLILVGLILSPEGGELWKVLANRILTIFAVWITAITCIGQLRAGERAARVAAEKVLAESHNAALRESSGRLEAILEAAVDGIITIDGRGIIMSLNPAVKRVFGYEPAELLGENVSRLMPTPHGEQHDGYLRNYMETGEAKILGSSHEVEGLHKDGRIFPMDLSVSAVECQKEPLFTGIVRDITGRKEAERELSEAVEELARTNAELARRNTELDEFTGVASHDLQEPLRKLVTFSDLLEMDLGGDLPPRADEDLDFIRDSARRMSKLVQDLLQLSRAGRSAMNLEPLALDTCVDRALEALGQRLEETGAELVRDELPMVNGDATLLTQLYQNLIGNALKFVPEGRKPVIRLSATATDEGWECAVEDNGIGIDPEQCDAIFSPFKRLHGREQYEGSGIGLSICRRSVERHAGRIRVESAPGEGSRFLFTLPALTAELRPAG